MDMAVHRDIIMQFIALLMPEKRWHYLQQDGATAHTATETINFLLLFFGDRLILKGLWPPRSPDLTFYFGVTLNMKFLRATF